MKIVDNPYKKEFVFDLYSRIYPKFKEYDKITRKKMLEKIIEFYSDYNNIIDMCTYREIKFLKRMANREEINYDDERFKFEKASLIKKMLVGYNEKYEYDFYDELKEPILLALSKVKMSEVKKKTELNEFLIGFYKVMGNFLIYPLINITSSLLKLDDRVVFDHVFNNKLFNYYVMIYDKYMEVYDKKVPIGLYIGYFHYEEELDEARKEYAIGGTQTFDLGGYINIFYDDFNFDNKIVKKFYKELMDLPFFGFTVLKPIRIFALLNKDRESLKDSIRNVPALKNYPLGDFFKLMDQAMDEMPSGALNGMCPREYKEKLKEQEEYEFKREMEYTGQKDACLGDDVAKGFYNLYFSLLEYINNKYYIDTSLKKIYKQESLDPNQLMPIIEYLFKDKEKIIDAYLKDNPHNFDSEDLEKVSKFKQGIRGMFTIAKYEEDYTAVLSSDRVYMIKGLNSNIDEVIPYRDIPCIVTTSLFPYDGVIVYDGLLSTYPISMGTSFVKMVEKEYNEDMKYYHL